MKERNPSWFQIPGYPNRILVIGGLDSGKTKKRQGLKHCDDPKDFIEYSIDMDDIYENIDEYNPNKKL